MTSLGAEKSPSVFLLKNEAGKWSKVYEGAIDDNPQVEAQVKEHYIKNAIESLLNADPEGSYYPTIEGTVNPKNVTYDAQGNIYVLDLLLGSETVVKKYSPEGKYLAVFRLPPSTTVDG